MSEQLHIDAYSHNFALQAPLLGKIFSADEPTNDNNPERQRAIDAFGQISFGGEGDSEIIPVRIKIRLSLTELALDSMNNISPSEKIAKFLHALKNEIEVEVGRLAIQKGSGGGVLSTAKSKSELYGNWSVTAKREAGETVMDFIGDWEVGFVK